MQTQKVGPNTIMNYARCKLHDKGKIRINCIRTLPTQPSQPTYSKCHAGFNYDTPGPRCHTIIEARAFVSTAGDIERVTDAPSKIQIQSLPVPSPLLPKVPRYAHHGDNPVRAQLWREKHSYQSRETRPFFQVVRKNITLSMDSCVHHLIW